MQQEYDDRNRDLIVGIDDTLVHRDRAGISPFDSVVQGGDAVWEGLRLHGGRIFKLTEHLARLRRSAQALAFVEVPPDEWVIERIRAVLAANEMTDDVHIRLTLTRGVKVTSGMDPRLNRSGPTLIVLAEFKSPVYDDSGISLVTSSVRRHRPGLPGPEDPPQQPAHLDPGQGRGERRRRRRRADARRRRVRRRDERDPRVPRRRTTSSARRPPAPAPRGSPARRSSRSARPPGSPPRSATSR